ncbi:hypothetical protein FOA43_000784 [Brettanomyces nanus]|uniref:Uncharacterized protein n=1 Tax=Eeniella nana TaxID=13502 RepID=A0A875RY22_EENNA|nr:uncharacterized protein FOA43_000784 [Brettanomyces nanus]QPG73473.1 hypothetical protein FOA43_000784 [Brettanomyces nanus]
MLLIRYTRSLYKPGIRTIASTNQVSDLDLYARRVQRARSDCTDKVHKFDPSSFLLSKFYPPFLQPIFIALKAFNIELARISMGSASTSSSKPYFADMKFTFWDDQIDKVSQISSHSSPQNSTLHGINDPISILIADSLTKGIRLDLSIFKQIIYSHKHYLHNEKTKGFSNIDSMCSFGEGTCSQTNYLLQSICLTPGLYKYSDFGVNLLELPETESIRNSLSDICAHIGQATAVCSFIIGLKYYAQKNGQIALPIDVLAKSGVSQEDALRMVLRGDVSDTKTREALKNAVFEVTTVANDHIISARSKLQALKDSIKTKVNEIEKKDDSKTDIEHALLKGYTSLKKGLPDCLYTPFMASIPTVLYLERLQKYDFDVLNPKLQFKEWRLAYRAYRDYNKRTF